MATWEGTGSLAYYTTKNDSGTAQQFGGEITEPPYVITGLINDTTYYVWVKPKNSLGVSEFSPLATGIAGGAKNLSFRECL